MIEITCRIISLVYAGGFLYDLSTRVLSVQYMIEQMINANKLNRGMLEVREMATITIEINIAS